MSEALKPSEVLSRAADLIEPEGRWGTLHYATGACGQCVDATGPLAVCFCLIGAVRNVSQAWWSPDVAEPDSPLRFVRPLLDKFTIPEWNDDPHRTQAEVVAALRKAADLAREAGQ